ncbi:hypothetical protein [Christiangramia sp.]|uniref:hypothetical protein n=1 Tax=Christiangramia sp. TaxID=1931228 RepID=UPI0026146344|nr:hypothetical protein [Christiangramia sp.]
MVKEENKILIPIGKAQLKQEDEKVVVLKKLSSKELLDLPVNGKVKNLAIEDKKNLMFFLIQTGEKSTTPKKNFTIGMLLMRTSSWALIKDVKSEGIEQLLIKKHPLKITVPLFLSTRKRVNQNLDEL